MTLVDYVKNCIGVRRFEKEDADEVSKLIVRNFLEVNSKDYGITAMRELAKAYDSSKILNIASYAHMYVFELNGRIIGTGSISSFWGSKTESILLTIFVLPEFHGKGIGRKIINTLEQDEFYVRATRIEIPASIVATEFYRKFGYDYKNGVKELDEEHHYRLEKFRGGDGDLNDNRRIYKTEVLFEPKVLYGEQKHLCDKCIIVFLEVIFEYMLETYAHEEDWPFLKMH